MPAKAPPPPTVPKFLLTIWEDWGARVSGILSVPFTYLAVIATNSQTKAIYALLAIAGVLVTTYQVWAKERTAVVAKYDEIEKLSAGIQEIPGPELNLAYDTSQGSMMNWPLCIQSMKGGIAYRVRVKGLEYGDFVAQLREIAILREGTTEYFSSSESSQHFCYLHAAIAGLEHVAIPVTVLCEDSSNRRFELSYEFIYKAKTIPVFRPTGRRLIV